MPTWAIRGYRQWAYQSMVACSDISPRITAINACRVLSSQTHTVPGVFAVLPSTYSGPSSTSPISINTTAIRYQKPMLVYQLHNPVIYLSQPQNPEASFRVGFSSVFRVGLSYHKVLKFSAQRAETPCLFSPRAPLCREAESPPGRRPIKAKPAGAGLCGWRFEQPDCPAWSPFPRS